MSSGTATLYLPGRFATLDEPADSCLSVELRRSPPTDRCPCPRGLRLEWRRSYLQLGSLFRYCGAPSSPSAMRLNISRTRSEPGCSVTVLRFFSRPWKWVTSLLLWPVSCGSPGQLPQGGWIWWAALSQSKRPTAPFCLRGSAPESAAQVTQTLHRGC